MTLRTYKIPIVVIFLIIIGFFLRFYNLSWGEPYFFHPDERNIASAISQLSYPTQFNPHFFAYGGFPIYIIFLSGVFVNYISSIVQQVPFSNQVSFEQAIMISRFYSATFSFLLIPLLFLIGGKLLNRRVGILSGIMGVFSVGFIQFAHFGTFEMWLTFFTLLLFWTLINIEQKKITIFSVLCGILLGILIGTKVSSVVLLPLPIIFIISKIFYNTESKKIQISFTKVLKLIFVNIILLTSSGITFAFFNPYVLWDYPSFFGSMKYESGVGLGSIIVFYTGEFVNTVPIIFHFLNVVPFILNPFATIIFLPLFFYLIYIAFKKRSVNFLLLIIFFLITFVSQAVLYVKWVRYLVPSLPYIILIVSISTFLITERFKRAGTAVALLLIFSSVIFSASYFITAFVENDTRTDAYEFAKKSIPPNSPILSEVYDLGIVPFNETFTNISLFNFYDLDSDSTDFNKYTLNHALEINEYLILPSQRIYKVRLTNPVKYPEGFTFYNNLLNGSAGFEKIYETPCSVFCRITYLSSPIYAYEQTASVFDRPVIMIFKKL